MSAAKCAQCATPSTRITLMEAIPSRCCRSLRNFAAPRITMEYQKARRRRFFLTSAKVRPPPTCSLSSSSGKRTRPSRDGRAWLQGFSRIWRQLLCCDRPTTRSPRASRANASPPGNSSAALRPLHCAPEVSSRARPSPMSSWIDSFLASPRW